VRKLLIGALGLSLTGCSHSPPSSTVAESCRDGDRLTLHDGSAAAPPLELVSFRTKSANPRGTRSPAATRAKQPSDRTGQDRHAKMAASRVSAAKGESAPSLPLSPPPSKTPATPPEPVTAAAPAVGDNGAASLSAPAPDMPRVARSILQEVAAAAADAERGHTATAGDAEGLVAVLMTRPTISDVSDLTGKTIAIDGRFAATAGMIRTAIVAAGATEVQLSEVTTAAIDRLANDEVPAAIVALAPAEAADAFPDITGFRTLRVPLSPRALKPRP
jgi:hypothetical protein